MAVFWTADVAGPAKMALRCARAYTARVHVPRRTDKHTPPFPDSCRRESGTRLGSGSHIEAQIGTQLSALGSHLPDSWRVLKTRRDSDSHPPLPPAGAYQFAPDPISKKKKEIRL